MTQAITLSTSSVGASIYYTTDGSTPTTSSTLYTGAIPVDTTTTIKALASGGGFTDSTVFSATYTILSPQLYVTGNGFNTGTSFADTSGYAKTITLQGNAQTSTTQSKFGGSSALFDGTGDSVTAATSTDFAFGTGDFFVCGWVRATSWGTNTIFDFRASDPAVSPVCYYSGGTLYYYTAGANRITGGSLSAAAWIFLMLSRVSGSTKMYVNGAQVGSTYADTNNYVNSAGFRFGDSWNNGSGFNGHQSHWYVHKGNGLSDAEALAWYNANVAFAPHPDLLLHMDGTNGSTTFTDSSNSALTVTANGNAQLSTSNPKFGTAAGTFDGTGDYLSLGGQAAFAYGSCDFTIEGWLNPTANAAKGIWDSRPASTEGAYPSIETGASGNLLFKNNSTYQITGATNMTTSTWQHVALVRKAGSTKLYLGGVQQGSTYADTVVYLNGANRPFLLEYSPTGGYSFNGLADEWQSIKGFAKYDGNFTPPTRAFVN